MYTQGLSSTVDPQVLQSAESGRGGSDSVKQFCNKATRVQKVDRLPTHLNLDAMVSEAEAVKGLARPALAVRLDGIREAAHHAFSRLKPSNTGSSK